MDELPLAIAAAFDSAYPGDDKLISHPCAECNRVRDTFKGTTWKDWKDKELSTSPLALFTPEAFRYYLPAYLLRATTDVGSSGGNVIFEGVLFALADPKRTARLSEDEATVSAKAMESLRTRFPEDDPIQDDFNDALENLTNQAHRKLH